MKPKHKIILLQPPIRLTVDYIRLTKTKAFVMVDTGKACFCVTMSKASAEALLKYKV